MQNVIVIKMQLTHHRGLWLLKMFGGKAVHFMEKIKKFTSYSEKTCGSLRGKDAVHFVVRFVFFFAAGCLAQFRSIVNAIPLGCVC